MLEALWNGLCERVRPIAIFNLIEIRQASEHPDADA